MYRTIHKRKAAPNNGGCPVLKKSILRRKQCSSVASASFGDNPNFGLRLHALGNVQVLRNGVAADNPAVMLQSVIVGFFVMLTYITPILILMASKAARYKAAK